jgi:predicted HAD superfamily Cof-like phosphohydrolase
VNTPDHQAQVREFMEACGQNIPVYPKMPTKKVIKLRANLINEEFNEFVAALPDFPDRDNTPEKLADIADSLADLLYVIYGSAIAFGIDIHPIFNEVHRSNMTKFGGGIRHDGKVMKGPNYEPPQITSIISYQIFTGAEGGNYDMTLRGGVAWEETRS